MMDLFLASMESEELSLFQFEVNGYKNLALNGTAITKEGYMNLKFL